MVDSRACCFVAVANVSYHIGDVNITATENDRHQGLIISYQKRCLSESSIQQTSRMILKG